MLAIANGRYLHAPVSNEQLKSPTQRKIHWSRKQQLSQALPLPRNSAHCDSIIVYVSDMESI